MKRRYTEGELDPHRYDDMLELGRPLSRSHPPMSLHDRAAQFAPFAALTGYEEAVEETNRRQEWFIDQSTRGIPPEEEA